DVGARGLLCGGGGDGCGRGGETDEGESERLHVRLMSRKGDDETCGRRTPRAISRRERIPWSPRSPHGIVIVFPELRERSYHATLDEHRNRSCRRRASPELGGRAG